MSTLQQILAAVDGSDTAERGLQFAIERARCHGASIAVAYAVNRATVAMAMANPYGYVDPTPMLDAIDDDADTVLAGGVSLAQTFGVSATGIKLEGLPAEAIVNCVKERAVHAVVAGTHGRHGFGRLVIGSVAESIVVKCAVPVFVVPRDGPQSKGPLTNALVCVDGSPASETALTFATRIAGVEGMRLTLCTVADPERSNGVIDNARVLERARERLKSLPKPVEYQLLHGNPVTEITSFAEAISADCVFAGTHGRRGIARLVLGSVTSGLLQLSRVPVCTVHHE